MTAIPPPDPAWSPWLPLEGAGRNTELPTRPGLYRIRSVETGAILYVGQTGRSLRGRLGQLGGVFRDLMPYNDPHTAGPALWAHRGGAPDRLRTEARAVVPLGAASSDTRVWGEPPHPPGPPGRPRAPGPAKEHR